MNVSGMSDLVELAQLVLDVCTIVLLPLCFGTVLIVLAVMGIAPMFVLAFSAVGIVTGIAGAARLWADRWQRA